MSVGVCDFTFVLAFVKSNNVCDLVTVARDDLVNNGMIRGGVAGIRGNNGDYKGIVGHIVKDRVLAVLLALLDAYTCHDRADDQNDTPYCSADDGTERDTG